MSEVNEEPDDLGDVRINIPDDDSKDTENDNNNETNNENIVTSSQIADTVISHDDTVTAELEDASDTEDDNNGYLEQIKCALSIVASITFVIIYKSMED